MEILNRESIDAADSSERKFLSIDKRVSLPALPQNDIEM